MVCTGNMDRSPTAAMVLAEMCAPMWVTSAGTEPWAKNQVSIELVEEADGKRWAEAETDAQLAEAERCLAETDMPADVRAEFSAIAQFITTRQS